MYKLIQRKIVLYVYMYWNLMMVTACYFFVPSDNSQYFFMIYKYRSSLIQKIFPLHIINEII